MAKNVVKRSFDDVLALLGTQRFDVAAAHEGAQRRTGAVRVSKYGCAAEIMGPNGSVAMLQKPGWLLGGEICRLIDKGYQKFLRNSRIEIPATADILRALHKFELEFDSATGEIDLYNEALGTTSDVYLYDRVAGRPRRTLDQFCYGSTVTLLSFPQGNLRGSPPHQEIHLGFATG